MTMGVIHFAPIGTSPGAVTSALAYLVHNQDKFAEAFKGQIVESIVIFASYDVADGTTPVSECIWNEYQNITIRKRWRRVDGANVVDVALQFIKEEIAPVMPRKGTVYCWEVDVHDFDACFNAVARATLALAPQEKVGKNIWANLTGGTNVLNAAILEVAFMSGLISRIYYTFVANESDRKYLQPPTSDPARFRWDEIPLVKTAFDEAWYCVPRELAEIGDWYEDEELLERLKSKAWQHFSEMGFRTFKAQFLNKMDGRELEYDASRHRNRLSTYGREILERISDPLFQDLIARGEKSRVDVESLRRELIGKELWSKP